MSRDRETLIDIGEAIKLILRYVEGVDFDSLAANIEKQDVITHDYDEVDLDEVWAVINENLPELLNYIEPLTHENQIRS